MQTFVTNVIMCCQVRKGVLSTNMEVFRQERMSTWTFSVKSMA